MERLEGHHHEFKENVDLLSNPSKDQEEEFLNELRPSDDKQTWQPFEVHKSLQQQGPTNTLELNKTLEVLEDDVHSLPSETRDSQTTR